jgi:hypothetical protein
MMAVKEESQILWNHLKLLQLCFSDRKFVVSAEIPVQAISELIHTGEKQQ